MSKNLSNASATHGSRTVQLTSYWGGDEKGPMLQITMLDGGNMRHSTIAWWVGFFTGAAVVLWIWALVAVMYCN